MQEFKAKVSFYGLEEDPIGALVSIVDEHLTIDVSGRRVGRWPIDELSPEIRGDSLLVSAEGERLVIDVTDPDQLRVSMRIPTTKAGPEMRADGELVVVTPDEDPRSLRAGSFVANSTTETVGDHVDPSPGHSPGELQSGPNSIEVEALRSVIRDLQKALAAAKTQLRWVQDLTPRRLPILTRADEAGLGVVQGVSLKERRPLPGSDGLQPWVVVDSGNVYITDRRMVFSGAQDVEFEFDEIVKKGASKTGLLLGVSSRTQTHILSGPGERLAVVLTAVEKIARGVDPTVPFREAISWLASEIAHAERRIESLPDTPTSTQPEADQRTDVL